MPRVRAISEAKEPHSVSLKVLRLSRPSLAEQHTLPTDALAEETPELKVASQQSYAYPSHPVDNPFILSPLLTLPPAFGTVSIGECFSCCLSANNETQAPVTSVQISAAMQTPSHAQEPEDLELSGDASQSHDLQPGATMQKIVRYNLKEEGNHVLAVTVTYSEAPKPAEGPDGTAGLRPEQAEASGRTRTFRKLYQFIAQQCLTVRSKTSRVPGGRAVLEAQLENVGEAPICLQAVKLSARKGWESESLNWDKTQPKDAPLLRSRDVMQVAFLLFPEQGGDDMAAERVVVGQLNIEWRSASGDRGFLSTGNLSV